MKVMKLRAAGTLCMLLIAAGWAVCTAQIDVQVHLDKPRHLAGEPVYLIWEYTNNGASPALIGQDDLYCDEPRIEAPSLAPAVPPGCSGELAVHFCTSSATYFKPGEKLVASYLLNHRFDLTKPGEYELTAWDRPEAGGVSQKKTFRLVLNRSSEEDLRSAYEPYFKALASSDLMSRTEAVRALAGSGARFTENALLQVSLDPRSDSYDRSLANAGLARLRTPLACARLAELAVHPELHQQQRAIMDLGRCGDSGYMSLLFGLADRGDPNRSMLFSAAAEAGGEAAVDRLLQLASRGSPDRETALYALGRTGSGRAARAILDALPSLSGEPALYAALTSLKTLTHRESKQKDLAAQAREWADWWATSQQREIYPPRNCSGGILPLR
jgi:hypothetical protein